MERPWAERAGYSRGSTRNSTDAALGPSGASSTTRKCRKKSRTGMFASFAKRAVACSRAVSSSWITTSRRLILRCSQLSCERTPHTQIFDHRVKNSLRCGENFVSGTDVPRQLCQSHMRTVRLRNGEAERPPSLVPGREGGAQTRLTETTPLIFPSDFMTFLSWSRSLQWNVKMLWARPSLSARQLASLMLTL